MHELSLATALVDATLSEARKHGAGRIDTVRCRIGRLRQVDDQLLRDAFEIAAAGTIAAGAALDVSYTGIRIDCHACGVGTDVESWRFDCPRCGESRVSLTGGDELELTSIDVEVDDENRCSQQESGRKERQSRS